MKKFLKFLLKGLISNEEVIEGSKKHSYLSAIVILLLSLVCSVVPAFVNIAKQKGSAIVTNAKNASIDTSLVLLSQHLSEKNIEVKITDGGTLAVTGKLNDEADKDANEYSIMAQGKELLVVRYCQDDEASKYATMYSSGQASLSGEVSETPRSYMILSPSFVYISTYLKNDSTKNKIEINESTGTKTIKTFATANATYSGLTKDAKGVSISSFYTSGSTQNDCLNSWKSLLNKMYSTAKTQYLWGYTGLIAALNLGVTLLVSLLIFVLTRLKSSTGEKLNYFQAFRIVCFASLCPAILSLALGFMISMFTQVGFILCLGLRSTFLGMRASNPEKYQAQK